MESLLGEAIVTARLNVSEDERAACFDVFSMADTCFREESAEACQLFDELAKLPGDLDLCEPLRRDVPHTQTANAQFRAILEAISITAYYELAEATGTDYEVCRRVYGNPMLCDGKERAAVLQAMDSESFSPNVWLTDWRDGLSVGEALSGWVRENFDTPARFYSRAQECELKSYLIGIVGELTEEERTDLLYARNLKDAIKDAAARESRYMAAVSQLDTCISALEVARYELARVCGLSVA